MENWIAWLPWAARSVDGKPAGPCVQHTLTPVRTSLTLLCACVFAAIGCGPQLDTAAISTSPPSRPCRLQSKDALSVVRGVCLPLQLAWGVETCVWSMIKHACERMSSSGWARGCGGCSGLGWARRYTQLSHVHAASICCCLVLWAG